MSVELWDGGGLEDKLCVVTIFIVLFFGCHFTTNIVFFLRFKFPRNIILILLYSFIFSMSNFPNNFY
jgi:hypothetical protein